MQFFYQYKFVFIILNQTKLLLPIHITFLLNLCSKRRIYDKDSYSLKYDLNFSHF